MEQILERDYLRTREQAARQHGYAAIRRHFEGYMAVNFAHRNATENWDRAMMSAAPTDEEIFDLIRELLSNDANMDIMYFCDGRDYSTIYWISCPMDDRDYDLIISHIDDVMPESWRELPESYVNNCLGNGARLIFWAGVAQ